MANAAPLFLLLVLGTTAYALSPQTSSVNGRIVGGTAAATNAAPYIVSFQYDGDHYCGGSIINANWVVTAAHCLTSRQRVLSTVLVAGSNNVAGTAATTQKRNVNSYVVHDLYTGGTAPYDIGLVYTRTTFQWTAAVGTVSLPKSGAVPTGTANLYGWGSTSTTSTAAYPAMLQVATNLPIISESVCASVLGSKGANVHSTNFCTGPLTGNVGICKADSGGPLVQSSRGKTILIGIVSWGELPCGQRNSPSVYVQVSDFTTWISTNQVV